ncbi:MAG: hypothetical protein WC975_01650 [Phycisphaerae bacterium]
MTNRKKVFLWLISITIALLIGAICLLVCIGYRYVYDDYSQRRAFDARIWTKREAVEKSPSLDCEWLMIC